MTEDFVFVCVSVHGVWVEGWVEGGPVVFGEEVADAWVCFEDASEELAAATLPPDAFTHAGGDFGAGVVARGGEAAVGDDEVCWEAHSETDWLAATRAVFAVSGGVVAVAEPLAGGVWPGEGGVGGGDAAGGEDAAPFEADGGGVVGRVGFRGGEGVGARGGEGFGEGGDLLALLSELEGGSGVAGRGLDGGDERGEGGLVERGDDAVDFERAGFGRGGGRRRRGRARGPGGGRRAGERLWPVRGDGDRVLQRREQGSVVPHDRQRDLPARRRPGALLAAELLGEVKQVRAPQSLARDDVPRGLLEVHDLRNGRVPAGQERAADGADVGEHRVERGVGPGGEPVGDGVWGRGGELRAFAGGGLGGRGGRGRDGVREDGQAGVVPGGGLLEPDWGARGGTHSFSTTKRSLAISAMAALLLSSVLSRISSGDFLGGAWADPLRFRFPLAVVVASRAAWSGGSAAMLTIGGDAAAGGGGGEASGASASVWAERSALLGGAVGACVGGCGRMRWDGWVDGMDGRATSVGGMRTASNSAEPGSLGAESTQRGAGQTHLGEPFREIRRGGCVFVVGVLGGLCWCCADASSSFLLSFFLCCCCWG